MSFNRTLWRALSWLLTTGVAAAPPVQAQAKEITLAVVKALPDSSSTASIVREPGATGRTIVFFREGNVDAVTIATAFTSLNRSLKSAGEELKTQIVITLHGLRSLASLSPGERQVAVDYVARLRNAKLQELAGFGLAKVLVVTRDTLRQSGGR